MLQTVFGPLSVGNKDYMFYTKSFNWINAKDHCANKLGGELASVKDAATQEAIEQYITDQNLTELVKGKGFWIGLNDRETEDEFVWIDGEAVTYINWSAGNPNNNTKKDPNGQDCVQLWTKKDYKWDDDYCWKRKSFICEFEVMP
ncbi:salivary C-type lectin 2-like [Glandiceps talaboti]